VSSAFGGASALGACPGIGADHTTAVRKEDRGTWLLSLRRESEQQEDALSSIFDQRWGEIEDTHRAFVERFLSMLPPGGRVLDAACGTGKYFGVVLDSGLSLVGVDHSAGHLARARAKFPQVPTEKRDLQELPYEDRFDGVMCVDAMEMVPPEDWPIVLERFRRALRPGGLLYLTVERVPEGQVRELNEEARRLSLPVVEGEVMWKEDGDDLYHHYPAMEQVRTWLADVGFAIQEDAEGPWHEEGYAYHHMLARLVARLTSHGG
jgi:SAM-dependent methyltransferase